MSSSNNTIRCPTCNGAGFRWRAKVADLPVVKMFPRLHGLGDRKTVSVICGFCKGHRMVDRRRLETSSSFAR